MATPSPISAMRNWTMMLTSVNVVSSEHEHERGQDRHPGDEQRQQRQERRVHEEQHQQRARRGEQGLDQDARCLPGRRLRTSRP